MPDEAVDARAAPNRIVEMALSRQPELVERALQRIRTEIAFYRHTETETDETIRAALISNLHYVIGNLTEDSELDLRAPEETGRTRAAMGVPLPDLLAAYRLSFSVIWTEILDIGRALPEVSSDDLVDLAGRLFELHERYAEAAVDGYREESREMLRTSERERAVLVELTLSGTASAARLWQVAQTLGLPLTGHYLVVAARSAEPGQDPLPRIESALAARDVSSVWRLESTRSLGVLSLGTPERSGAAVDLLNRHACGPIGVSPVFYELRQAGWATRLAQLALETNHLPQVRQFPDSPLDMLVAAAPETAVGFARNVLKNLIELPAEDQDLLFDTLQAWLDAKGSTQQAGEALFCHRNTIRYRLNRIETLTGRNLRNPAELAELVAATRAWRELPHPTLG
jgi:hypothetical protein